MGGGFFSGVVPCGTVWLFADKAKAALEAVAPFNWGEIQGIDIHGIWIVSWAWRLGAMGEVRVCVLWSWSPMHQGNILGNLPLET